MNILKGLLERLRLNKRALIMTLSILAILVGSNLIFTRGAPLETSKQYIYQNKTINERLGSIKDISLSMSSSFQVSGSHGTAQYELSIEGERENGVIYLDMEKQAGDWAVVRAKLHLSDKSQITLK